MEFVSGRNIAEAFENGRRRDLKGRYFRFDAERGARSKGDQQPDGRVAHNQNP
jgi:hypothetical protein